MYYLQFSSIYNPTFFFWTKSYRVSHDSTFVFILTTWTSRMLLMRLDCNSLLSVVSQFDWCRLSSAWQSQWPIDHRAKTSFNRVTFTELHNVTGQLQKDRSHMTSRQPFCAKNTMTRRPCLCTEKILRELFSCKNIHSCWPREGKGCIPILCDWLKNHGQLFQPIRKLN